MPQYLMERRRYGKKSREVSKRRTGKNGINGNGRLEEDSPQTAESINKRVSPAKATVLNV